MIQSVICQRRQSENGKIIVTLATDTQASEYHDFCVNERAWAIDLMVAQHKKDVEQSAQMMPQEEPEQE
jgi:hypothetical protein